MTKFDNKYDIELSDVERQKNLDEESNRIAQSKIQEIEKELKKLRLELQLRKNLSLELEKQKQIAEEANQNAKKKTQELDKLIKKQNLEAQLRKNLADEMKKQKLIAIDAQDEALKKKNEIEAISNQLSKYLAPQVYHSIFSGKKEANVVSQRKKLTVFFSDIVGFTSISDSLEAEEISSMLNYYLTEMSQIALAHGGTIDKYIGDAILIFFGDPESAGVKQDAIKCVNMAVSMQSRMDELKNEWAMKFGLKEPLAIRSGITTGYCTVGNFGSEDRLDYTVIGSQVNLAARLESIAKPGSILISFETYNQVLNEINCVELEKVSVKGIREEIRTFEVLTNQKDERDNEEIKTDNLKLTADLSKLKSSELDKLEEFIGDIRNRMKGAK